MRLFRSIAVYGSLDVATKGVALVATPFITRLLTPEEYGSAALLLAVWLVVALAQFGGMDAAFPFFRSRSDESTEHVTVVATTIATLGAFALCLGFSIFGLAFSWYGHYAGASRSELLAFLLGLFPLALMGW